MQDYRQSRWLRATAILPALLGGLFLSAWLSGVPAWVALASTRCKTNTSVCLVLAGLALLGSLSRRRAVRQAAQAAAALSAVIGAISGLQYAVGADFGIDQWLAHDPSLEGGHPNRMAPNAALSFVLMGASLWLLAVRQRALLVERAQVIAAQAAAVVALGLNALALVGYLYSVQVLYKPTIFIRISPYTAAALSLLSIGAISARPRWGIARRFASAGMGGYLVRRLLLPMAIAPIALGWLLLAGERVGLYSDETAYALSATSTVLVLATTLLLFARWLDELEAARRASDRHLQAAGALTSALSSASTVDDVVRATLELGVPALEGRAGAVLMLEPDADRIRVAGARGYPAEVLEVFGQYELSSPRPVATTLRTRQPLFIGTREALVRDYPELPELRSGASGAWAVLPLEGRARPLGAIALSFEGPRLFDAVTRERLLRLASQCAQALDRALLFDSERSAREQTRGALEALQSVHRAQRATNERLHATLDAAAIGTYLWELRENRIEYDSGVAHLLGLQGTPLRTRAEYLEHVHPDDRAAVEAAYARCGQQRSAFELHYRVRLADGSTRWMLDKAHMIDESAGGLYLAGAIVDLTREYTAREQAEAANRAKDEFLAMLGHELRNPLSPIVISLQLMKMRAPETFEREREVIERQVQYMVRLVDDLLDTSRITRGKIELRKRRVAIPDVVEAALELASPLLEKRRQRVDVQVQDHLFVQGDPDRLAQVVTNLLTNASRYSPTDTLISVRTEAERGQIAIRVRDQGAGIAPELLPKVFDAFVQSERPIDRAAGGLGLGLSIVRGLVELHGGEVSAASEGPGKGSEFTVRLPADQSSAPQPARSSTPGVAALPSAALRVLVVDDNRDAALGMAEAFELAGHQVRVAFDGPSALTIAAEQQPNVVFLDIGLPAMDGYEVARRMRAMNFPHPLKLIALTGYGQHSDRARSRDAGFDLHLVKPVAVRDVLSLAQSETTMAS